MVFVDATHRDLGRLCRLCAVCLALQPACVVLQHAPRSRGAILAAVCSFVKEVNFSTSSFAQRGYITMSYCSGIDYIQRFLE